MVLLPPPPVRFTAACPKCGEDCEWIGQAYVKYKIPPCPHTNKQQPNKESSA